MESSNPMDSLPPDNRVRQDIVLPRQADPVKQTDQTLFNKLPKEAQEASSKPVPKVEAPEVPESAKEDAKLKPHFFGRLFHHSAPEGAKTAPVAHEDGPNPQKNP